MDQQNVTPPALPRTIEASVRRYLHNYTKNFVGPATEMFRLRNIARANILILRKVAPRFYEDKLPIFINQACSTLLTFDTSRPEDVDKYHRCHRAFICILEGFRQSQPAGEINFHNERVRLEERIRLGNRHMELKARIEELEATEFDYDELGEDETENMYEKLFRELDTLKHELKRVAIEIAYIEGHSLEEVPTFELKVAPTSTLKRLTKEQLDNLESQMLELVKQNKNKRTAMYVDKSVIDSMIEKLNVDASLFKKEEIRDLTKDALDAYKSYFRNIDLQNREVFYNELLSRKSLMPRDGIPIKDPDDVPEEVKIKLEQNNRQCKREIDELLESYSKRPCAEDHAGDLLEASDDDSDETQRIIETVRRKGIKFERVKEEPRDDCEPELLVSGDEFYVEGPLADAVVDDKDISYVESRDPAESDCPDDDEVRMENNGDSDAYQNGYDDQEDYEDQEEEDEEEDIECLGVVEPNDKIKTFDLGGE